MTRIIVEKRGDDTVIGARPLASIVMPLYNCLPYVGDCLQSVLSQSYENLQVIIVDDGSDDGSWEYVRGVADSDPRVEVYRKDHENAGVARNFGFEHVEGDFVYFLDSDDLFHEDLVAATVERFEQTGADACVFQACTFSESIEDSDGVPKYLAKVNFEGDVYSSRTYPSGFFQVTNPAPWTKAFRTELITSTGLRFQSLENANDFYFDYSALVKARSISVVRQPLSWYRTREGSLQNRRKSQPDAFLIALLSLKRLLIQEGLQDALDASFTKLVASNCVYNLRRAIANGDLNAIERICERLAGGDLFKLGMLRFVRDHGAEAPSGYYRDLIDKVMGVYHGEYADLAALEKAFG